MLFCETVRLERIIQRMRYDLLYLQGRRDGVDVGTKGLVDIRGENASTGPQCGISIE